jgi:ribosomal-protein-alanine N-acetyltransferase
MQIKFMLNLNFNPFPNIETERLSLRQVNHTDAKAIFVLRSDEKIMRYIPRPIAKTVEDAIEVIDRMNAGISSNESINWAITLKGDNKLIGVIGYYRTKKEHYRSEVGYMLHTDFHRKGIMQEALTAVLDFGFNKMKLHSIEAVIDTDNIASAKLLEKNKFIKEAHFREYEFYDGKFLDATVYSLLTNV